MFVMRHLISPSLLFKLLLPYRAQNTQIHIYVNETRLTLTTWHHIL